jgi:putative heme-binding domain-containing protein
MGGRVVSGIATEDANGIKLVSDQGTVVVPRAEVRKVKLSELSVMPEGLLGGLKDDEVTDLVAYLRSPRQVPLPPDGAGAKTGR